MSWLPFVFKQLSVSQWQLSCVLMSVEDKLFWKEDHHQRQLLGSQNKFEPTVSKFIGQSRVLVRARFMVTKVDCLPFGAMT